MDHRQNKPLNPSLRYRRQPSGSDDWQEAWIVRAEPDQHGHVMVSLYSDGSALRFARPQDLFRIETESEVIPVK